MDFDDFAGSLVQQWRLGEGLTQAELAERMTERGFPMRQQTVLKIEKGSRSLRLDEALALSDILGADLYAFRPQATLDERLAEWYDLILEAQQAIITAVENYVREAESANRYVEIFRDSSDVAIDEYPMAESIVEEAGKPLADVVAHAAVMAEERIASQKLANSRMTGDPQLWVDGINTRASEVAEAIRAAAAGRVEGRDGVDPEA